MNEVNFFQDYKSKECYSPENLSSGQRIMLKLIKVALNLKLPLFYDLKKSGNFKFWATFMSFSIILRTELRFSGLYNFRLIWFINESNISQRSDLVSNCLSWMAFGWTTISVTLIQIYALAVRFFFTSSMHI